MAHPGKLTRTVSVPDVLYDPTPSREPIDGLGATDLRPVGSQSLVRQRSQQSVPDRRRDAVVSGGADAPAEEAPAKQPDSSIVGWVRWFVSSTIVPAATFIGTELLVNSTPEQYRAAVRPLAHIFNATVVQPAVKWLSDRLLDALNDPKTFKDSVKAKAALAASDPKAALRSVLPAQLPSKQQVGRGARQLVLGTSDAAATLLMVNLAGRAAGYPHLASALTTIAPQFGHAFRGFTDLGLDVAVPMTEVAEQDAPKVGDQLTARGIWPAVVTGVADRFDGQYDATIRFEDASKQPGVSLIGTAVATTGQEKRITAIGRLAETKLVIGVENKYELTGLDTIAYGEHTAWSLSASRMAAVDGGAATLDRLTVSPIGWIEGAFTRDGQRGLLGGQAPGGVKWPVADAPSAQPPALSLLAFLGSQSIGDNVHNEIVRRRNLWLMASSMHVLGWVTAHRNLLRKMPSVGGPPAAQESTQSWLSRVDPSNLLAEIAAVDLVPSFLRSGYPKLRLDPYELKIGREPSLSFGMTTSLTLWKGLGEFSATEVVLAWLPNQVPSVRLRAGRIAFGDALVVTGLELDPKGGVRTQHALMKVPLPRETFSLPAITLSAEYLTVGHEIGFRSAKLTAQEIAIGDVLTIDTFEVGIEEAGKNPRLAAAIRGGHVKIPGLSPLSFAGGVRWGADRPAEGKGTIEGSGLSALGGMVTAKKLSGTLAVKDGTAKGTIRATDLAIAYKDYLLTATADVSVDRHGVEAFHVEELAVSKGGDRVGAATGVVFERDKTLVVGKLALDLPRAGAIRATKADPGGAAPQLATTDLDLSSLVRKPDKADAPSVEPPRKPAGLAATNLGRLEVGPTGASPFLALDFTRQKRDEVAPHAEPAAPGALSAVVSGDLRAFRIPPTLVTVSRSANNENDVRVVLEGIKGDGYSIDAATYDDGKLIVTSAKARLDLLLGSVVPDALRGLVSTIATTFEVDVRTGRLLALEMSGELSGTLFGGAARITDARAKLVATPGSVAAGALANGLSLAGSVAGKVAVTAFEQTVELDGSVAFPSGTPTLSGRWGSGLGSIVIDRATFKDGKPIFESAQATFKVPKNELIKFVAHKDKLKLTEDERASVVVLVGRKVQVEPASGLPIAAESEQVSDSPLAVEAQPPSRERALGVHLPQIRIGDGFVLTPKDYVNLEGGDRIVELEADLQLRLGLLNGGIAGTIKVPVSGGTPHPENLALEVAAPELTIAGIAMRGIRYQHGKLSVASASVPTSALLGGFPLKLGLDRQTWDVTNLEIDVPSKTVSVGALGTTAQDIRCLDGALTIASASAQVGVTPSALDGASLIPKNWALTLAATGARIAAGPIAIGGSAKLVIGPGGLASGELTDGTFQFGVGETSIGKLALTPDGWEATDVTLVLGSSTKDPFGVIDRLPSWLPKDMDYQVRVKFPLAYRAKDWVRPSLAQIELDVLKGGLKLPGIGGSFERTKGRRTASIKAAPLAGGFDVNAQLPLAQGVGLEIGGGLKYGVSLEANDVALAEGDDLSFAGAIAGSASLRGTVRVGVFGGIPALFTVSGGIYAALELKATLAAEAGGSWKLPKKPDQASGGSVELYLNMGDRSKAQGTMLTGEAGAYASVNVLGFGKTIEKPLAKAQIAEVIAHGFAKLDSAQGATLLPTGAFPTHVIHLHPALEGLLLGGDTKKAISLARQTVDRGVGKLQASEELLAMDAAKAAEPGDKPWRDNEAALRQAKVAASQKVKRTTKAIAKTDDALARHGRRLDTARDKLANYENKLDSYKKESDTVEGRAAISAAVDVRLDGYEEHQGLVERTTKLNRQEMQTKIDCKQEEIRRLLELVAETEQKKLAQRTTLATDTNSAAKATKQATLAGKTKRDVEADRGWRQRRLIEMYGSLHAAHKQATDQAARRVAKSTKLEADKQAAEERLATLSLDPHATAIEKKFWKAQVDLLTEELDRVKTEAAPARLALSEAAEAAIDGAMKAQPSAAQRLTEKVTKEIDNYQRRIEAITVALSQNFLDLDNNKGDKALEAKRRKLLAELAEVQVQLDGALARGNEIDE